MQGEETVLPSKPERQETYSHREQTTATTIMAQRTASVHAAFLQPYLQPGMRLLDAGCGPGTITLDLARWLAPGEVIGIDQGQSKLPLPSSRQPTKPCRMCALKLAMFTPFPLQQAQWMRFTVMVS